MADTAWRSRRARCGRVRAPRMAAARRAPRHRVVSARVRWSRSEAVGRRSRGSPRSRPARQSARRGADASPPSAFVVARTHLIGERFEFIRPQRRDAKPLVHGVDEWWRTDLEQLRGETVHALRDATGLLSVEHSQARQRALRPLELMLELRDRIVRRAAHEFNGTGRRRRQRHPPATEPRTRAASRTLSGNGPDGPDARGPRRECPSAPSSRIRPTAVSALRNRPSVSRAPGGPARFRSIRVQRAPPRRACGSRRGAGNGRVASVTAFA